MTWKIRLADAADIDGWVALMAALWPEAAMEDLREEAQVFLGGDTSESPLDVVFLAIGPDGRACGMIELSLRSYAEGCAGTPVPYVEGWYVMPDRRGCGVGRALIAAAEDWAMVQGFAEIASDAQIHNTAGQAAHAALGFVEVERAVHFRKALRKID
jgi:aminoglycoside 6'-N-acetyltransferase I